MFYTLSSSKSFFEIPVDILFSMITYLFNSQENSSARVSFLMTLQTKVYNFIKKETLTQVFSCEFCKISKKTCFAEHLWATASFVTVGTQSYESFLSYIIFRKLIFVIFFVICVTHKKDMTRVHGSTK